MDNETTSFPRGDIRASDAERDQAVAELSQHFQAGRLTQEEFEDRSSAALTARTGSELRALFSDLPRDDVPGTPAAGRAARPATGHVRCTRRKPVARVVIACVIAAIVAGNVLGNTGHANFGWLVPAVILCFVFLRVARRCR